MLFDCGSLHFGEGDADRIMRELDAQYPQYGLAKNKGYGTAEHMPRWKQYGPAPIHRRSFIGHFVEG